MSSRKLGRVVFSDDLARTGHYSSINFVLSGQKILRRYEDYERAATVFVVEREDFREVPQGEIIPIYTAEFVDGKITFHE